MVRSEMQSCKTANIYIKSLSTRSIVAVEEILATVELLLVISNYSWHIDPFFEFLPSIDFLHDVKV